ncbi:hypothetical protein Ae201684P_015610 [Aphanomyces euteiches]|nr:hypothetical protein Ae201684P_015610 [Aphanomyces euteiches]
MIPLLLMRLLLFVTLLPSLVCASDSVQLQIMTTTENITINLATNESIAIFPGVLLSLSMSPSLMLAIFPRPQFLGDRTFLGSNFSCGDLEPWRCIDDIGSLQVTTVQSAHASSRSDPTDVILAFVLRNRPYTKLVNIPVGRGDSNLSKIYPWYIESADIPPGIALEGYYHEDFEGPAVVWNTTTKADFMKSLRVRRQNEPFPPTNPLNVVTLYRSGYANSSTLSISVGQSAPSLVFLWKTFPLGFLALEVPPGLVFLAYTQPNFEGRYNIFTEGFYLYNTILDKNHLHSFRVLKASDPLPSQPDVNFTEVAQCRPLFDGNITMKNSTSYPFVTRRFCIALQIPQGLAVILYDRPWFLGGYSVWTMETAAELNTTWILRMRSLRVVDIRNAPPLQSSLLSTDDSIVTIQAVGSLFMIYKLGDSVPGASNFEFPFNLELEANMTDGLQLILCSEFNFQGTCQSYSRNISYREKLMPTFRSYKVVRTGDIASSQNSTDFVGCFPPTDPYIEWTPIFLQANDTVNELIYPWDQNMAKFTVPRGMVVAAFSEPFLKGDCFAWTADADDLGHWNKSVRSLMATTVAAWSGCPLELKQNQAFINEITYVTQLSSPYIVSVIGVAWTNAMDLQCVMEYMNLGDLRSYLENVKSFSWESKVSCALSVAEGLFYLHIQHLIHRDVKSRNILMDSVKGAKLGDFGASKEVIFGDTMTAVVGTLRWMAPEMMLFKPYTSAVDIYSFGVVLSELSTHKLPYANALDAKGRALSEEAIASCVIHDMMRPSFGNCPEWFSALGMKCMAQSPKDRPTAVQIIHRLKADLKALRS